MIQTGTLEATKFFFIVYSQTLPKLALALQNSTLWKISERYCSQKDNN